MQQPTKQQEREIMRQLQEQRETQDHRDPQWVHDYWRRDDSKERIKQILGFGLLRGNGS